MRRCALFILYFLLPLCFEAGLSAQEIPKKAKKYFDEAKVFFKARDFYKGNDALEKAIKLAPDYAEAHYMLANSYNTLRNYERATFHYKRVTEIAPDNPAYMSAFLVVAGGSYAEGKYEEAKNAAEKYNSLRPSLRSAIAQANLIIKSSMFAIEGMKKPVDFKPEKVKISTAMLPLQFFPALSADKKELYFTARINFSDNSDENIYSSQFNGTDWSEPVYVKELNTHFNEGTCSISADGKIIIFTACDSGSKDRPNFGRCDLFISRKQGGVWSQPENIGGTVNSKFWESNPSLSADGRTLYFASDRPGGLGRVDVWVTKMDADDKWTTPVNLGKDVNTTEDDISPFIHVNGKTLFFASDGHLGYGGFDLFKVEMDKGVWGKVANLGYPINKHNNQVSLFITSDGNKGYYSDELFKGGAIVASTLMQFDLPEEVKPKQLSRFVRGTVFDSKTKQKLEAKIDLVDLGTKNVESSVVSDGKNGDYLIVLNEGAEYGLYVNKPGYLFKSLFFNVDQNSEGQAAAIDVPLDPIVKGEKVTLHNIFFASGSFELDPKSHTELERLYLFMKNNKEMRIEISGHTDDVGSDDANLKLSLNRAKSVFDFISQKGIEAGRVTFQGYGETQPVAANDTDANKAKNRRIEFKIL